MSELVSFSKIKNLRNDDFGYKNGKIVVTGKDVTLSVLDRENGVEYLASVDHIDKIGDRYELCADHTYIFAFLDEDGNPTDSQEMTRIYDWLPVHNKLPSDLKKETMKDLDLKTLKDGEFIVFEFKADPQSKLGFFYVIINSLSSNNRWIIKDEIENVVSEDLDKYYGLYRRSRHISQEAPSARWKSLH